MVDKPTIRQISDEFKISRSWAHDVLSGKQPARALACQIYRKFGWKAPVIAHLSDDQISVIEQAEKLSPTGRAAA